MQATAQRLLRNEDDARDAVQDAFLSAFKALPGFAGDSLLSTWLHRITVNAALMKLRKKGRTPEQPIDDLLPQFDERGHWATGDQPWEVPGEEAMTRRETRALVRACIDELPESYRTALMLRDIEDLDNDEVAAALGISANAAKIRVHRARQALRTLLARSFAEPSRAS
jgi:RNA polymerase sigma-70 factor (ECF subfamily)